MQVGIAPHIGLDPARGCQHHRSRAADAQRDHHGTAAHLIGREHIAGGVEHLHIARRGRKPHGQHRLGTEVAAVHVGQADRVFLVQAAQVIAGTQADIAPDDHRFGIQG